MELIYIIEDEASIRMELVQLLTHSGYRTAAAESFDDIAGDVLRASPDLILLDVNLPGANGTFLCRQIREKADIPIIFVTGRSTSMDELEGMMAGADDYVAKPYHAPVLLARIAAVLKRSGKRKSVDVKNQLVCGGVCLNILNSTVSFGEKRSELTKNEFRICYYLFSHSGQIVPRADLIEDLWENQIFIDDNTLSVNVTRIRAKLQEIGAGELIKTRRGQGYIV
ncbi:Glycopeptide resistance-associated protein R [uncultured Roseburia sp.]|uniref:Stage 0 sporulation protein A homolog n=1 Tax=Brotonthovivens ammoniilytica TaxID=2981725 RepID=A0ABT2TM50_9FIRM|nr:response regulator transcription factor [Brotonthovivens ammoniilytica]MCU6763298.1 response regulator transcription factor [Brotonthovivens ammoniilytica]SCJ12439.1 Glycopeptide resistance-associated protein R [uncultured Roseburia sp.]